jgi:phage terminase small subunit
MAKRKRSAPLSERERRFVEAYMGPAAGNATAAARLAGYSDKTAGSQASRLLKKVNIQNALRTRVDSDPQVADREARQRFWTSVMGGRGKFAKVPWKDRLKASELLGKTQGDFVERHEHTGKDGKPISARMNITFGGRYKPANEG